MNIFFSLFIIFIIPFTLVIFYRYQISEEIINIYSLLLFAVSGIVILILALLIEPIIFETDYSDTFEINLVITYMLVATFEELIKISLFYFATKYLLEDSLVEIACSYAFYENIIYLMDSSVGLFDLFLSRLPANLLHFGLAVLFLVIVKKDKHPGLIIFIPLIHGAYNLTIIYLTYFV